MGCGFLLLLDFRLLLDLPLRDSLEVVAIIGDADADAGVDADALADALADAGASARAGEIGTKILSLCLLASEEVIFGL
jgi:hypothetical protein